MPFRPSRPPSSTARRRLSALHLVLALLFITAPAALAAPASPGRAGEAPPPGESGAADLPQAIYLPIVGSFDAAQAVAPPVPGEGGHDVSDYELAERARQRNEPPFVAPADLKAASTPATYSTLGQWGPVTPWPFVFATAASLPDGRIIAWGGNNPRSFNGGVNTYAAVWDPASGAFTDRSVSDHSMFCAIPTMLEDGRVFVNGGDGTRERTSIFDYRTDQWRRSDNMNTGRWYPGSVALPSGEVLTVAGEPGSQYPERWSPGQGWSYLTGASIQTPILSYTGYQRNWLPVLHLAPNGQVFHSGPTAQMHWITPSGNGGIAAAGLANSWYPKYAASVMYEEGKILVAGGAADDTSTALGTNKAAVLDLNGAAPVRTVIAPMAYARKFNNGVVLPNGEVLILGGNTSGVEFSDSGTILTPEIWSPTTQTWREAADMSVPRNYHSVALLMVDGRVWSAGGGLCNCSADHPDAQIYSPPYLFNPDGTPAARPAITSAPSIASPGQVLDVTATPGLDTFRMIKMSGITHNLNSDLRALKVSFAEPEAGRYQLTLKSNVNVLTPGYWMLFGLNGAGVPSVAKVIQVLHAPVSVTNPTRQSSTLGAGVSLPVAAVTANGGALTFSAAGLPAGLAIDAASGLISGAPTAAGTFQATVTATDSTGASDSTAFSWVVQHPATGSGQILRQWWTGVTGAAVADLTASPAYPASPTGSELIASFEAPTNWADNYGTRIRGYVHPPATGQYTFWIAGDDNSRLLLSTDASPANAREIASVAGWTNAREWTKYAAQQSAAITLQAGQMYYIEALQKEGGGGDNLAVSWRPPGGAQEVIPGAYMSPYVPEQPFQYIKFEALSEVNGNPWTSAAELSVLDAFGAPLSRSGWTVTADSQETASANNAAANAVDGSAATIWHTQWSAASPPPPHWLVLNLGAPREISGLRYLPRQDMANGRVKDYRVWLSQDGVSWATLAAQGTFPNDAAEKTITIRRARSAALELDALVSPPKQVGAAVTFTATARGGSSPRFKWLFGDGTPETAYSASPTISHTFGQPGLSVVKVTVTDDSGVELTSSVVQASYLTPTAARPAASGSIAYETRAAGDRVWAVNPDNDSVSVFDAATNARVAEIAVGAAPRSLAIAPDGRVWVTNKRAASISLIDPASLAVVGQVALPYAAQPFGLAFAPNGGAAYVALEGLGRLLKLNPASGATLATLDVGPNVRHLAVSADSASVYVSRFITPRVPGEETASPQPSLGGVQYGGEVVLVSAGSMTVAKTIVLQNSTKTDTEQSGRGIPNYLAAPVIAPDGQSAWVPSKQDNILRGTLRDGSNLNFQNTVRAISSRISLPGNAEDYAGRIDHDNAGMASAAAFDRTGSYLFVALETNRQVAVVDAYARAELFRFDTGRAPQGLAVSPDNTRLYVQNFMERTVSVHDITALINRGQRQVSLVSAPAAVSAERLAALALIGKQLFYDARDPRLALDGYISCASCHNDGGGDGRVWDLTGFGEGLRNTADLNGRAGMGHGALHWSANFDEVQDFEGQIRALAGGTGLMGDADFNAGTRAQPLGDRKANISADLDALAAYVSSLTSVAPSPSRASDGSLTAAGAAGRLVFISAQCAQCHGGAAFTDSAGGTPRAIGTIKPSSGTRLGGPLTAIDTPTLRGVWATAPYLHDGSAATLADAVRAHSGVSLAQADLDNLTSYLRQIGSEEPAAPGGLGSGQILREWWTGVSGTDVASLTASPSYPYSPTGSGMLTSFEAPANWADNYGTRVRGYVYAPVTGQYTFWIASDDSSVLRLSTNDSPGSARQIASVSGYTAAREWTKYASQQSAAITLQAGQRYYIEAVQKEGTGADHLAVAWQVPGGARAVIAGEYLAPYQRPTVANLAPGTTANQVSTSSGGAAGRAVDGSTNGNFAAGSVTLTNKANNAWWQTDLGAAASIESIEIWNRTDCCSTRLSNVYIFVSNTSMAGRSYASLLADTAVWRYYSAGAAPAKLHVPAGVSGRYVRVQLAGNNNLSLAEVQVFGRR